MSARPVHVVGDLGHLPRSVSGHRNVVWWGNFGFMLIEGMAFLLAAGCAFYLVGVNPSWPPSGDRPPDLLWGTLFTVALMASEAPNLLLLGKAKQKDEQAVRRLALLMCAIGLVLVILRGFEFAHLGVGWQRDAYGGVIWMLMLLHSTHIVTELGEAGVQTLWLYTHEVGDDQFADEEDGANYWTFVVLAWLPIYGIVYWLPRLL